MDGHNSLNLTSLTLLYRFVIILYIWTIFLLLNTFWHERTCLVTHCNDLHYIISFDLHTVSMTLFIQPKTISKFLTNFTFGLCFYCRTHFDKNDCFVWIYFLLSVLTFIPSQSVFLMQPNTISKFLTFFTSGLYFTAEHILTRMVTLSNVL
jgi:hypothetical protein